MFRGGHIRTPYQRGVNSLHHRFVRHVSRPEKSNLSTSNCQPDRVVGSIRITAACLHFDQGQAEVGTDVMPGPILVSLLVSE